MSDLPAGEGPEGLSVLAYTIPYSTYRLMMCLRCAKTYPEELDKQPVTRLPPLNINRCDKCHVRIPRTPVV